MSTIPITKVGAEQLKAELHRLKTVDRIETSKAIGEARLQGDISENAEYEAAKEKQSFIEGRIQEIEGKLGNAQVIDPKTINSEGKVVFGATVEYEDCDTEKKSTYQIVGEDEADFKIGKISIGSPLARAFIGKSAGDVVEVQAPGGARDVEILSVRYI
ncbi:MAG: transcription elongation factor GreA [Casimicrobium sp.]